VLVHGVALLLFVMPPWLCGGASMASTTLLYALWVVKKSRGFLPSTLYVQTDNGSEKKKQSNAVFVLFIGALWSVQAHPVVLVTTRAHT
jgi:hypothetical protein